MSLARPTNTLSLKLTPVVGSGTHLDSSPHLAVLQRVVGNVRDELLGGQRDQPEDPGIGGLEAGRRQVVLGHRVRNCWGVLVQLEKESHG